MSDEKLYMVKNDKGKYWDFKDNGGFWRLGSNYRPITMNKSLAIKVAKEHGGHVITLVEEPEKVVLSEKQAEIVEDAHNAKRPASYIILKSNDEELLMNAYVNGFTVARDKKYRVLAPKSWWRDSDSSEYMCHSSDGIYTVANPVFNPVTDDVPTLFTQKQLEQYNLTSDLFKKQEVIDDGE